MSCLILLSNDGCPGSSQQARADEEDQTLPNSFYPVESSGDVVEPGIVVLEMLLLALNGVVEILEVGIVVTAHLARGAMGQGCKKAGCDEQKLPRSVPG